MTTHVIQFSSGIGSWATARRVAERHGTDNLILLFADTRDEDPDNYRFATDAAANIGAPLITVADGRDVKQVMRDERFLGNSRIAPCSKHLKQIPCRKWLQENTDPAETILYVGIDASEIHRIPAIVAGWAPWPVEFPMTEPPYIDKLMMLAIARADGLEPPSMYRDNYPHANCLHPDTRFITDGGIKTLRECLGKSVRVLGRSGGWRDAEIHSFGEQELWEIRLSRLGDEQTILATPDHLWPVRKTPGRSDYRFKPTSALEPGSRLAGMYGQVRSNVRPSPIGIAAGFTFGDGDAAVFASGQNPPARAHLCGGKIEALLPYFETCRTSERPGVVTVHDLPRAWKRFPGLDESQSYLYGWLAGYFAADGSFSKGSATLSSARRENLEFVRDLCARLGIGAHFIRQEMRVGYGTEPTPLYRLALQVSTLRPDFFVLPKHRQRFEARPAATPRPGDWQIVSAVPTGRTEEVMCAVVPDGHVFTLDGNILTHNCGGRCVRQGQAGWALTLRVHPDRYAEMEAFENEMREELGDVAMMKDRTGGETRPLTLTELRTRIEAKPERDASNGKPWLLDPYDFGGCGCLTEGLAA